MLDPFVFCDSAVNMKCEQWPCSKGKRDKGKMSDGRPEKKTDRQCNQAADETPPSADVKWVDAGEVVIPVVKPRGKEAGNEHDWK
jgi:hypothetical protein